MTTITRNSISRGMRETTDIFSPEDYMPTQTKATNKRDNIALLMGQPTTTPCLIPVLHSSTPSCINSPFMVNGKCHKVTALSFGSPHGAVFVDDIEDIDIESVGKTLGEHVLFPDGASIVFIQTVSKTNLKAKLWQRELGQKPYTPEAISVAGTAAIMLQKVLGSSVSVSMGECSFDVKWDRCGDGVKVSGPPQMLS